MPSSVQIKNMTISSTKSQIILRTVPLDDLRTFEPGVPQSEREAKLCIEIYFQLKPQLSSIINFITLSFGQQMQAGNLDKLSVNDLCLILSHRKVNVASEDEVIDCLITWLTYNSERISDAQLQQLVFHVNWPYVSFDKLLMIFNLFPVLRRNEECKSIFFNQIQKRATKKQNVMTAPPRCSYNSVMVETMFDYKFFVYKMAESMINSFDRDQQTQQELNRLRMENIALSSRIQHMTNQHGSPNQFQRQSLSMVNEGNK